MPYAALLTSDQWPPGHTETSWYLDVNRFARHTGWLHAVATGWALWAGLVVLAAMTASAYVVARRRRDAPRAVAATAWAGVAAVVALALNQLVAGAVQRPRPYSVLPHVEVLVTRASDYSLPSDHAVIAGALATGLLAFSLRLGAVAWLVALSVAFARVYVGAHYPGDVLAGLALGALVAGVLGPAGRPVLAALARRLAGSPLGSLVTSVRRV